MAVDASCFDEAWPLTVESGILYCDADAVTFASSEDAVGYAVNGMASTRGAPEIDIIWADAGDGLKVNISPLISLGLGLCTSRTKTLE